jgi:hypothetical protein
MCSGGFCPSPTPFSVADHHTFGWCSGRFHASPPVAGERPVDLLRREPQRVVIAASLGLVFSGTSPTAAICVNLAQWPGSGSRLDHARPVLGVCGSLVVRVGSIGSSDRHAIVGAGGLDEGLRPRVTIDSIEADTGRQRPEHDCEQLLAIESELSPKPRANRGERDDQGESIGRGRLESAPAVEAGCVLVDCVDEHGSDPNLV